MGATDILQISSAFAAAGDIKASIASSTSAQVYGPADFNGRVGAKRFDTESPFWHLRLPTVTTTAPGGNVYDTTRPIVFTGFDSKSNLVQSAVALTSETAAAVYEGDIPLVQVVQIDVPRQGLATGAFQFGLGSVCFEPYALALVAGAAGTFRVRTVAGKDRDFSILSGERISDPVIQRIRLNQGTFPFVVYV